MFLIIVGASTIGLNLVTLATTDNDDVVVIEKDPEQAEYVRTKYDCVVINDDATSLKVLEEVGGGQADALIATTGDDETNIMVCLIGQEIGVQETASVVNNAGHRSLFQRFDIKTHRNPSHILAEHFYTSVRHPLLTDRRQFGEATDLLKSQVSQEAPIAECTISEAVDHGYLSDDTIVITINRDQPEHDPVIPNGETRLKTGDQVVLLAPSTALLHMADAFD